MVLKLADAIRKKLDIEEMISRIVPDDFMNDPFR